MAFSRRKKLYFQNDNWRKEIEKYLDINKIIQSKGTKQ